MKYLLPLLLITSSCFAAIDANVPTTAQSISVAYAAIRANFAAIDANLTAIDTSTIQAYDVTHSDYGAVGDGSTDDETAIESAITAAAVNGGIVYFPATGNAYKFLTAITVPSNVTLLFDPGATLMGDGSATLTLNGGLMDTPHQIFESTMTATGFGLVPRIRPEWWATNTTPGTTDMSAALQAACNTGGHVVISDDMMIDTAIDVTVDGTQITARNVTNTIYCWDCNGFDVTGDFVSISDFKMTELGALGAATGYANIGIHFEGPGSGSYGYNCQAKGVVFAGWDKCIKMSHMWESIVDLCECDTSNEFVRLAGTCARSFITNCNTSMGGDAATRASVWLEFIVTGSYRPEGIIIDNCNFNGGHYGVYSPVGLNGGVTITNCDIICQNSAVHAQTPNLWVIADCTSLVSTYYPVLNFPDESSLVDHKCSITNNHIWSNINYSSCIYIGAKSRFWTIKGNTTNTDDVSIEIGTLSEDISISNNTAVEQELMQTIKLNNNCTNVTATDNSRYRIQRTDVTTENGSVVVMNNTYEQKTTTRPLVPTNGQWNLGDRIFRNNSPTPTVLAVASYLGESQGWACATAGSFSSATDSTGDTVIAVPSITGMTDTSDFYIGDYVTISAGYASASIPYLITGVVDTITYAGDPTDLTFVDGGAGNDTLVDSSDLFKNIDGVNFRPYTILTIAGSTSNDGSYMILAATQDTLSFATGSWAAGEVGAGGMTLSTSPTIFTLDAPTSTQSNVTVATVDPTFVEFGQYGYREGSATPAGSVTPLFIGEEYLDSTNNKWYKSYDTTNADWAALN